MQEILLRNLVAFALLTNLFFKHNEIATNFKEETEEVDLISIFPFKY
ncbi:hypothetical protein ACIQ69_25960 [Bacillus paramycoides]